MKQVRFLLATADGQISSLHAEVEFTDATKSWDGGGDGVNWNSANNRNPNGVPTSSDDVTIGEDLPSQLISTMLPVFPFEFGKHHNSGATLNFNSGSQLTVGGNVTVGNNGNANRKGSINMTSGGILKIGGSFSIVNLGTFTRGTGTIEYKRMHRQSNCDKCFRNL